MSGQDEEGFVYGAHRTARQTDPAFRRMVLGAGGVSVVVIGVALLWGGVRGTSFGPPPEVHAPPGPLRVAPANPGGLVVPEANVPIMSGDVSAAPPELAPTQVAPDITQLDQAAGVGVPAPAPVTAAAPAVAPNAVAPGTAAPVSAPVPANPASAAPVASALGRPVAVQLAATADEPGAETEWRRLQHRMPALLGSRTPDIVPAVVGGQSVWRLRLSGFASIDAAQDFCAQVKAQGAACTVATF